MLSKRLVWRHLTECHLPALWDHRFARRMGPPWRDLRRAQPTLGRITDVPRPETDERRPAPASAVDPISVERARHEDAARYIVPIQLPMESHGTESEEASPHPPAVPRALNPVSLATELAQNEVSAVHAPSLGRLLAREDRILNP